MRSVYVLVWLAGACAVSGVRHQRPAARQETAKAGTIAELLFSLDGTETQMKVAIDALARSDVARDVGTAKRRGERRLIGLYGYAVEIPGVDENGGGPPNGYITVLIKGTSDFIRTETQARFQQLVREYAEKYNSGLLGLSSESGVAPPGAMR